VISTDDWVTGTLDMWLVNNPCYLLIPRRSFVEQVEEENDGELGLDFHKFLR